MAINENRTVDYKAPYEPDGLAGVIANLWTSWKQSRAPWEKERAELRNYLFATDTSTTTNANEGWKNSTTRPKLTQIRDNLHANYMAALFPHDDFFKWEPMSEAAADAEKARKITAYMRNKIRQSDFLQTMSRLVYDYIDYGNAFAEVVYVKETHPNEEDNTETIVYVGPKLVRISPFNICFNIEASDFHKTPHIVRSVMTLGELAKMREDVVGADEWIDEAFAKAIDIRTSMSGLSKGQKDNLIKSAIRIDGFGNMYDYYQSGQVEVLEFNGDLYDTENGELYAGVRIIIIDRSFVVSNAPYKSWLGRMNKEHVGWRQRPDNLMAMGPLDNLVGMQYRIDHLENLKADVFDQIALPVVYQRGEVEEWEWGPGEKIYGDIDSDVSVLSPDATALNADFQIDILERSMEDMAGAPRQAMGIRTPGEKTAFEVQTLENNTGRIFQHKASYFDANMTEKVLNQMLAAARENLDVADQIRVESEIGTVSFEEITKEDLQAAGNLIPKGAKHFARRAQLLQNLNTLAASPVYADPSINVHMSGLKIALALEELSDLDHFDIVEANVRIAEQADTQSLLQSAQQQAATEASIDPTGLEEAEEMLSDIDVG